MELVDQKHTIQALTEKLNTAQGQLQKAKEHAGKQDITISELKAQILGLLMDIEGFKTEKSTLSVQIVELTKYKELYEDHMINRNTQETQESDDEDAYADDPAMRLMGYKPNGDAVYKSQTGLFATLGKGKAVVESAKELVAYDKHGDPIQAQTRRASIDSSILEEDEHPTQGHLPKKTEEPSNEPLDRLKDLVQQFHAGTPEEQ